MKSTNLIRMLLDSDHSENEEEVDTYPFTFTYMSRSSQETTLNLGFYKFT